MPSIGAVPHVLEDSVRITPGDMLEALTRIVADRSVGAAFFGSYYLMDYELMGGDARQAIIGESNKRGMTPFLPPGMKSTGWSSPSVYADGDTMQAMATAGITYTLDQMDSDIVSQLNTPGGPLVLLPYPVVTVDMGQNLARMKSPTGIERLWLDYVLELAEEAPADSSREATTVVIGIHPFVVGTPDGAAAMRRVLTRPKSDRSIWLTDTKAILKAIDLK
jgi:hypothetical protein